MKQGAGGAVLAVLAGWLLLVFPVGDGWRHGSYDFGFRFRADVPVTNVAMIYADTESANRLWQGLDYRWDRGLYADLLDRLTSWGALAVAFDIAFSATNHQDAAADIRLAQAIARHGRVILAARSTPIYLGSQFVGWGPDKPTPQFSDAAAGVGYVEVADDDLAIRKHNNNLPKDDRTLAWRVAEVTMPEPPSDPWLERWINYYGPPGALPWHSIAEVLLTTNSMAGSFSNRVVFVGGNFDTGFVGGKGTDHFVTPYTGRTNKRAPGAEVNATAYLNLARGDWLARHNPIIEVALVTLAGALFGFGLALCRPPWAVAGGLAAGMVVPAGLIALTWSTHRWFPWLIVVAGQIPIALGWSVLAEAQRLRWAKRDAEREKRHLIRQLQFMEKASSKTSTGPAGSAPLEAPPRLASSPHTELPAVSDHELLVPIGRGAYGEVWLARDLIGSYRAVKVVYRTRFEEDAPFEREFKGIQNYAPISLLHPGLLPILHVGRDTARGYFYYIMQLADDVSDGSRVNAGAYTAHTLAKEIRRQARLPLMNCVNVGIQLAEALEFLHRKNLIHRDIKPANIIFVNGIPKFADIGLVTRVSSVSGDVTYVGTEHYIAPEGPGSPAADVYALGKVLYTVAYGMSPSEFPNLPTALVEGDNQEAGYQLNEIILKACDPDIQDRYPSAETLRADLVQLRTKWEIHPLARGAKPPQSP